MNVLGVVINVVDLERSIEFYREVLGFTLVSQKEQLAAARAPGGNRDQVIVLRALGSSPLGGARHVGVRAFIVQVDSAEQLERIAGDLDARRLLVGRRDHPEWTAVVGRDPDGVTVAVTWQPDEAEGVDQGWRELDDFLYGIGE
jgi:catechol 2,3-dioxygenase-like lactoylglutathione lyase family enzyme